MPKELIALAPRQPVLRTAELITPVVPFEKSAEAYREIDEHPERCIKMGITYQG